MIGLTKVKPTTESGQPVVVEEDPLKMTGKTDPSSSSSSPSESSSDSEADSFSTLTEGDDLDE